jgi:hypothetical protein
LRALCHPHQLSTRFCNSYSKTYLIKVQLIPHAATVSAIRRMTG